MPFPSIITSFNYPTATSRLNNPSHSALENNQSSTIGQIEAVIGLADGGSVLGTIIGDLRSPGSQGGGHVQGASFGGTGQTTFNKGDIFVAQSASVISKLAVGTDGQVLQAQSGQSAGVQWSNVTANKVSVSNSVVSIDKWRGSVANVLFATSIVGSTLQSSNAIKFTGQLVKLESDSSEDLVVVVNYGSNVISSVTMKQNGSVIGSGGILQGMIAGNNSASSQIGWVNVMSRLPQSGGTVGTTPQYFYGNGYGNSSINSMATQNLTITAQFATGVGTKNSILTGLFVVEKIV